MLWVSATSKDCERMHKPPTGGVYNQLPYTRGLKARIQRKGIFSCRSTGSSSTWSQLTIVVPVQMAVATRIVSAKDILPRALRRAASRTIFGLRFSITVIGEFSYILRIMSFAFSVPITFILS